MTRERRCWCCSEPHNRGCVIGPTCQCGWDECSKCHRCPSHCTCKPKITVHVCGVKCEHVWDGPQQEFDEGAGMTATCSKCGAWAINVSMMEGV